MYSLIDFPVDYRQKEVSKVLRWICSGECAAVIGLSGSGKSNLLGFMMVKSAEIRNCPKTILIDCNRVESPTTTSFFRLIYRSILDQVERQQQSGDDWLEILEHAIRSRLDGNIGLSLYLDRFDALFKFQEFQLLANNLRYLRDRYKYQLTYVIGCRKPLGDQSELAELFYGHTLRLGPLNEKDAAWSARRDLSRMTGKPVSEWEDEEIMGLVSLSGGYPSFLRAVCEAAADNPPADIRMLIDHPAVKRRLAEFWDDNPSKEELIRTGIIDVPLLSQSKPDDTHRNGIGEKS